MSASRKGIILFLALFVLTVPAAFAYDVVVDGDPSEWVLSSVRFIDANEPAIPDPVDLETVSSTISIDQETLYLKFATYDPTGWPPNRPAEGGEQSPLADVRLDVCLDLDNNAATGAYIEQCNAAIGSEVWIQFAGQANGLPAGFAQYCTGPTSADCAFMPMEYAAQVGGRDLEIGLEYDDMNFACTADPSSILLAAVLDGANANPDDYLPAQGQSVSIPNNCEEPNSVNALVFDAAPNYDVRQMGAHIDTTWTVAEDPDTFSWTLYRNEGNATPTVVGTLYSDGLGNTVTYTMRDSDPDGILQNVTYTLVEVDGSGNVEYGPFGPYTYGGNR